ncbi:D-2-hydroxyacid dehydrogenase [Solicola gregarius]|uniref:D-2-hydroxyacid dehydrogenase n=1 Tax=Solicola gregarius TaxID=2908642 RepID=A0AA46TEK1_9ACTN|nr:D-2-hydroxyacid dehydrogenase [Solicola gregarius]UYM03790.1 D-2-hydroxyacid dehydrogenase [Solicola gregarius]
MNPLAARPVIAVLTAPGVDNPAGIETIEARADVRYTYADGLADAVAGADALLLWDFFSTAVRDAWPRADSLRWIHIAAAGLDKLLFDELRESEVVVTNARGVFDRPIAEFVLASILARAKGLHVSHDHQLERRWEHRETRTLVGEKALVVGTGAIGRESARLLAAVGMEVRGAGRTARSGDPDFGEVVESASLAEQVGWADHVVVAAPLTEQTRGLVGADVIDAMQPSAHLVNIGRGEIVDEDALLAALSSGGIAAASLDVFCHEPLPDDSPMWTTPGVVVSPHMSGDVLGWRETLARQFVDNARRFLDGEPLANVVDKRLGFVPADTSRSPRA